MIGLGAVVVLALAGVVVAGEDALEILASLYYGAPDIEAVELNPVTVGLLTDEFADETGHLAERPDVHLHQGDGRSYLARSDSSYDLVWYVAPDSYAANNAASSGAFVLSESYLYTSGVIEETLEHLTDDGIMVAQFGELDFENRSNRTSRYIVTARDALEQVGVDDPSRHLMVDFASGGDNQSTIIVKAHAVHPGRGRCVRHGSRQTVGAAADLRARRRLRRPRTHHGTARRRHPRRGRLDRRRPHPRDRRHHRRWPLVLALLRLRRRAHRHHHAARRARPGGRDRRAGRAGGLGDRGPGIVADVTGDEPVPVTPTSTPV